MPNRKGAAAHWTEQFPQLHGDAALVSPVLDVLRSAAKHGEDHPLSRVLQDLAHGLGRPLEIADQAAPERSFDERWLIALFDALAGVDLVRYQFLLRSRLPAGDAARAHFSLTQAQVWLDSRL